MTNLPRVEAQKFTASIKEIDKTVKYRAMNVREHKLLLQAIELKDESAVVNTIVDIVDACTFKQLNLKTLPAHIVDYLYLLIHTKSTGSVQKANYTCRALTVEGPCNTKFTIGIPLDKAELVYPEAYDAKRLVMITDTIGVKFKVPNFEDFKKIKVQEPMLDTADAFIYSCVESVFDEDRVYVPEVDFTLPELKEWLNELDGTIIETIGQFFETMPYLGLELPITCPKCGTKDKLTLRGLDDFFV